MAAKKRRLVEENARKKDALFKTLFEGPAGLILVAIIVAIFAGPRLPKAAKGIAESIKVFRKEVKSEDKTAEKSTSDEKTTDTK